MNIQEKEKKKKNYTEFAISFKDLVFDVKVNNAGKKPGFFNMIWFTVKSSWLLVVILIFVVTGTCNTLLYKLQNESYSKGSTTGPPKLYTHPWTQNFYMFLGMTICCLTPHYFKEFCCVPALKAIQKGMGRTPKVDPNKKKLPKINQLLFILPGICDAIASTILSVALILTYASIYQMLQCVTVVFTFFLSILLLKHNFHKFPHKWIGVFLVLLGSMLVGLNTVVYPQGGGKATARSPFIGACLVLVSCFIYALFYIFEEWFLTGYDTDPLQVPGYEGFWGMIIVLFVLFCIYWIPGADYGSLESYPASISEALQNPILLTWILVLTCNIGFYNMMGNVITLNISCATRSVLDQIRSLIIWLIQMYRGRQEFTWLQLAGFLILVVGVAIYNEFLFNIFIPWYVRWCEKVDKEDEESGKGSFWYIACDCWKCWKGCYKAWENRVKKIQGIEILEDEEEEKEGEIIGDKLDGHVVGDAQVEHVGEKYYESEDEIKKKPREGTRGRDYSMDQKDFDDLGMGFGAPSTPVKI